jgi:HSP20 family protein
VVSAIFSVLPLRFSFGTRFDECHVWMTMMSHHETSQTKNNNIMTLIKFKSDAPARPLDRMMNLNEFFNDFFDNSLNADFRKGSVPAVNISETPNFFHLEMAAPGFAKEDFRISVENDVMTVSAEKKTEKEEKDRKFSRREFSYSSFQRSFTLPETVDAEKIQAQYENGLMTVELPKKEAARPQQARQIAVK